MWTNSGRFICIDNWSQFGGPKAEFLEHIEQTRNNDIDFEFIENAFRKVDWSGLSKSNVYFFDGPHSETNQYDGVVIAQPALDDAHTLIVDDFNWAAVRNGTLRTINDLNLDLECSIEIRATQDNSHAKTAIRANSDWHNGYFMAVVVRR